MWNRIYYCILFPLPPAIYTVFVVLTNNRKKSNQCHILHLKRTSNLWKFKESIWINTLCPNSVESILCSCFMTHQVFASKLTTYTSTYPSQTILSKLSQNTYKRVPVTLVNLWIQLNYFIIHNSLFCQFSSSA